MVLADFPKAFTAVAMLYTGNLIWQNILHRYYFRQEFKSSICYYFKVFFLATTVEQRHSVSVMPLVFIIKLKQMPRIQGQFQKLKMSSCIFSLSSSPSSSPHPLLFVLETCSSQTCVHLQKASLKEKGTGKREEELKGRRKRGQMKAEGLYLYRTQETFLKILIFTGCISCTAPSL